MNGQGQERAWDVLTHVSALLMFAVPFGNILGPLAIWLIKRGDSASVDAHGKESLNFQISVTLYVIAFGLATVALMFLIIGFLLLPLLIIVVAIGPIVDVILVLIASWKASNGEFYRYPLTIRFLT